MTVRRFLDKNRNYRYIFHIDGIIARLAAEGRERLWLFENLAQAQPSREPKGKGEIFYSNR
jgi:hypothetical protein